MTKNRRYTEVDWDKVLEPELQKFFSGRRCLVTGAAGFVGSHLVEALLHTGAEVTAFVRATSTGLGADRVRQGKATHRLRVHLGDLRDAHSVRLAVATLQGAKKPVVFHLGAQAHVGESWVRPYETLDVNILGTFHLLQACQDLGLDLHRLDTAGTSEEYGNINHDWRQYYDFMEDGRLLLHERSPTNPKSIYATAKLAADFLTMNFFDAYGMPCVTTRMFNNYGPRQSPRYFTGTIISQALCRDRVEVGRIDTRRDMCFVTDGVRGHMHVAAWGNPGEVYVYGYGSNISMRDWATTILARGAAKGFWKDVPLVEESSRFRPGASDVEELLVGYDKLAACTGWAPLVTWEEGIDRTIEWYATHREEWQGQVDWQ